tara:strand:+ start:1867 stop:2100 length:234 start_codon:yes stop_codon:yes gene_type:complete
MAKKIDVIKRQGDGKFCAWVRVPISRLDTWTSREVDLEKRKFWFQNYMKWVIVSVADTSKEALAKAQNFVDTKLTVG